MGLFDWLLGRARAGTVDEAQPAKAVRFEMRPLRRAGLLGGGWPAATRDATPPGSDEREGGD
jgi:hypothetical protein